MGSDAGYTVIVIRRGVPHTVDGWHRIRPLSEGVPVIEDADRAALLARLHHGQAVPVERLEVAAKAADAAQGE